MEEIYILMTINKAPLFVIMSLDLGSEKTYFRFPFAKEVKFSFIFLRFGVYINDTKMRNLILVPMKDKITDRTGDNLMVFCVGICFLHGA